MTKAEIRAEIKAKGLDQFIVNGKIYPWYRDRDWIAAWLAVLSLLLAIGAVICAVAGV